MPQTQKQGKPTDSQPNLNDPQRIELSAMY